MAFANEVLGAHPETDMYVNNLLERLQYLGFPITCPNMFLEIELHDCKHFTEFLKDGGLK